MSKTEKREKREKIEQEKKRLHEQELLANRIRKVKEVERFYDGCYKALDMLVKNFEKEHIVCNNDIEYLIKKEIDEEKEFVLEDDCNEPSTTSNALYNLEYRNLEELYYETFACSIWEDYKDYAECEVLSTDGKIFRTHLYSIKIEYLDEEKHVWICYGLSNGKRIFRNKEEAEEESRKNPTLDIAYLEIENNIESIKNSNLLKLKGIFNPNLCSVPFDENRVDFNCLRCGNKTNNICSICGYNNRQDFISLFHV